MPRGACHSSMENVIASISSPGQRVCQAFSRGNHPRPQYVILVVAVSLTVLLSACASPTVLPSPSPTLETTPVPTARATDTPAPVTPPPRAAPPAPPTQAYIGKSLGVQLSYPADWLLAETDDGLIIGTSAEVIAGGELREGAGLVLHVEPLPNAEWENLDELAQDRASVFSSEEMEIGQPEPLTIDGEEASVVTLEGQPPLGETSLRGMIAVVIWERWLYSFVAVSVAARWSP